MGWRITAAGIALGDMVSECRNLAKFESLAECSWACVFAGWNA